jgi:hypothetical protein
MRARVTESVPSADERIAMIRSGRWIKYPRAEQILDDLEELFTLPKSHRMRNLLLVGDTNNGKTMIVNRFAERHPANANIDGEASSVPVIVVQAPPVPDEARFYRAILQALFAPFKPSSRVDQIQFQAFRLFRNVGLRMLIIDEIHHILAGTQVRQKHFLNVIKYLGNELQIPIVGVGTRDAFNAIRLDPQLENRFEPAYLPRWTLDNEYIQLLKSFERCLPLTKPFGLTKSAIASKILGVSEGTIGEISALLTRAAIWAIRNGSEEITERTLDQCGYQPPSKRRRVAV